MTGPTLKPIEAIEVGDQVWAWDELTGTLIKRRVNRLFRHKGKSILQVLCGDGGAQQTIEATTEHPFWVEGAGWVAACELQAGDVLKHIDGEPGMQVLRVVETGAKADVFNFEVDGVHNYFVGQRGVLVHNDSGLENPIAAQHDRAVATIGQYLPISLRAQREFGGLLVRHSDGQIYSLEPRVGLRDGVKPILESADTLSDVVPAGHEVVAYWHTHTGTYPEAMAFSYQDVVYANQKIPTGMDAYVGLSDGRVLHYPKRSSFVGRGGVAVEGSIAEVGRVSTELPTARHKYFAVPDRPVQYLTDEASSGAGSLSPRQSLWERVAGIFGKRDQTAIPAAPGLPQMTGPDDGFVRVYRGNDYDGFQVSKRFRTDASSAVPRGDENFLDMNEGMQHAKAGGGGTLDGLSVSTDVTRAAKYGKFLIVYDVPQSVFERLPVGDPALAEKVFKYSIPEDYRVATLPTDQALILKDQQRYAFPFHRFDVPFFVRANYMP